ncbi:McrB family protein [Archangium lansingense]|uniref:ATP-binding protein n=1 Tax=Archangium lansingense TaxID=2995310 RepID=A0ABT4ADI4_9BACT|nr:ATP-binding protein [Archangium lansinium]MCY1079690.1 ATP-binding protein [Archangium lansinium]
MLNDAQVTELWRKAYPFSEWEHWQKNYRDLLMKVRDLSDTELAQPENQQLIWSADAITTLGPGGTVKVSGAFTDPEIVNAVVALRRRQWPEDPNERADAMHDEGERILALVSPRHGPRRPQARLWRLFAALLPADFHCVFSYGAHLRVTELLLPEGTWASHVLIRDRLRKVLGPEPDEGEHVRRSIFCWWLYENYDAIKAGQTDMGKATAAPVDRKPSTITLWAYGKQFKGNFAVKRMVEAYRDVVQTTLAGISRSDLLEELGDKEEFKTLSLSSRRGLVARVTGLGLIEEREGLLRPTREGDELLENDVPDVLVQRMLERVFPMAAVLRFLKDTSHSSGEIVKYQQQLYPSWTGAMGPTSTLAWVRALDLVDQTQGGKYRLSEYGAAWEARLPHELPTRPAEAAGSIDVLADVEAAVEELKKSQSAALVVPWPDLATLRQRFLKDEQARGFVLDDSQLIALHHAWHCNPQKRFVILSGLSGTGKTALVRHYARIYCEAMGLEPGKHLEVVAVSPDWKDPTGLLGYYNALHEVPSFQVEPALRMLLAAAHNPFKPYFLLLDEMNLARVEQYFAPFLSSMESGLPVALHGQDEAVNGVPPRLEWPRNLFIAGTVNMDETTFPFSDKVLDRAFTLEFWDVNLAAFFEARPAGRQPELEGAIQAFHDALRPIRRHFGYRTAGELLAFVEAAGSEAPIEVKRGLLDQGVFSKVLPRLRGEASPELRKVFEALRSLCKTHELNRCSDKLAQMEATLHRVGLTRFWA